MDLQAEKLHLIEWLAQLKDEEIIHRIKALRAKAQKGDKGKVVAYAADGSPLTLKAYNERLKKAEEDIRAGRVTSQEDLEKEAKGW